MKYPAAHEIDEPRPVCILIVISGSVKSEPCASVFHVALKSASLLRIRGRIVKPNDHLVCFQIRIIHVLPVGGRVKYEVVAGCSGSKELQRTFGKQHVVRFYASRIKREHLKSWLLADTCCRCQ